MKRRWNGARAFGVVVLLAGGCSGGGDADDTDAHAGHAHATAGSPSAPAPVEPVPNDAAVPTVGQTQENRVSEGRDLNPTGQVAARSALPLLRMADGRFDELLAVVVDDRGLVRYDLLAKQKWSSSINNVVSAYAKSPLPEDRATRLAFWCNAYNANVLDMVLSRYDGGALKTVMDVPGFFDSNTITVAGESLTLNDLENERIRPLGDPRIHAALVCAANSCPPLRGESFKADSLEDQLDDQTRRWVADDTKNRVDDGTPKLSAIFDWYGADFSAAPYGGVIGFVQAFAPEGSAFASVPADAAIEFAEYDWALNQARIEDTPEK